MDKFPTVIQRSRTGISFVLEFCLCLRKDIEVKNKRRK